MVQAPEQASGMPHSGMNVNLFVSARDVVDMGGDGRADPKVKLESEYEGRWVKIGSTEKVKSNPNPDFTKALKMPYFFEFIQPIRFIIKEGKS